MAREDVEVIRRVYAKLEAGDFEGAFELLDPEIEWAEPPDSPSGLLVYHGRDEARRSLEGWTKHFEDYRLTVDELIDAGECVLARTRQRGRVHGVEIEQHLYGVWDVRDGKATRLRMFNDERAARKAAGLGA